MATLAQVRKAAAAVGGTVAHEADARTVTVIVDAPDGRVWSDGACVGLVGWTYVGTGGTSDMYDDLLARIAFGHDPDPEPEIR